MRTDDFIERHSAGVIAIIGIIIKSHTRRGLYSLGQKPLLINPCETELTGMIPRLMTAACKPRSGLVPRAGPKLVSLSSHAYEIAFARCNNTRRACSHSVRRRCVNLYVVVGRHGANVRGLTG